MFFSIIRSLEHLKIISIKLNTQLLIGAPVHKATTWLLAPHWPKPIQKQHRHFLSQLNQGTPFLHAFSALIPPYIPLNFQYSATSIQLNDFFTYFIPYLDHHIQSLTTFKEKIRYPIFLILSTLGTFILMLRLIVPQSIALTAHTHTSPILTILLNLNQFLSHYGLHTLFLLATLTLLSKNSLKKHLPSLILNTTKKEDILWLIGLTTQCGTTLQKSIASIQFPKDHPYTLPYQTFQTHFHTTGTLSKSLPYFISLPAYQHELLTIAEHNGNLPTTLITIAKDLAQDSNQRFQKKLSLIQPLCLTITAAIIFLIFYTLMIPLTQSLIM